MREFLEALGRPLLALVTPSERLFWLHLASAAGLATLAYLLDPALRGRRSLFGYLFPKKLWLHPSSRLDLKLALAKAVLRALWLVPWTVSAFSIALFLVRSLDRTFGIPDPPALSRTSITVLYTLTVFVAWDLSRYLLHRLLHRVPVLWEIHKVHHSAKVLTPLTFYRTHPLESLLFSLRGVVVTGLCAGAFFYVFRERAVQAELFGVNVLAFLFNALGGNLRHSHVWLSWGRALEHVFLSPAQHQIHHSLAKEHHDRNFGTWIALWDWLGGTLVIAGTKRQRLRFGLDASTLNHDPHRLISALTRPLLASLPRMRPLLRPSRLLLPLLFGVLLAASPAGAEAPPSETASEASATPTEEQSELYAYDAELEQELAVEENRAEAAPLSEPAKMNDAPAGDQLDLREIFEVRIVGEKIDRKRVAGSAHVVEEAQLERYEYNDVHRVLAQVPGVYTRDEEGFGLRPNIGLRGASSDRSSKVTLLEDGVPFAPAPYSAPAAYYFPLSTRMVGVEVFKGPAVIKNGPQTVGGAINLLTRPVPFGHDAAIDLAGGLYRTGKAHAYVGLGNEHIGFLLEGAHLESGGFKRLDGGGETGFQRNDLMAKLRLSNGFEGDALHVLELKLGYGDEVSHETYLGLTDEDFQKSPYRRYAASQNDIMRWTRTQLQARYLFVLGDLDVQVTAYRHDFHRAWSKLNGFRSGPTLSAVLASPDAGQTAVLYQILTGQEDSFSSEQDLILGTNDRTFVSQGLQGRARYELKLLDVTQTLEAGVRLHYDEIVRLHTEDGYRMTNGVLVPDGRDTHVAVHSRGSATAGALYLYDEIRWGGLVVGPGLRLELIRTSLVDLEKDTPGTKAPKALQFAWMPGLGASYQVLPFLGVLVGVHKGFSPVSPGQPPEVRPEESINYEAGTRLDLGFLRGELIGFYSHYSNLTGECTFSTGCSDGQLGRQYNGGAVAVYGLELGVGHAQTLFGFTLESELSYTLTGSRFLTSFRSQNPLFGDVEEGDELPYVPLHRGNLHLALGFKEIVEVFGAATFVSAMRDRAGQGPLEPGQGSDPFLVVDAGASYRFDDFGKVYFRVDNLFDAAYVAARRPYGARPGKPLTFLVGYKHMF